MGPGLPAAALEFHIHSLRREQAPVLLYQESDVIIRTIRDYLRDDIDQVLIDDRGAWQQAHDFVSMVMPKYRQRIRHYEDATPCSTVSRWKVR